MRRLLRVAQLSFWFVHADEFCNQALAHESIELVAVWDADRRRGAEKASRLGVPFVADLEALLADASIDAVSLCSEPGSHPEIIEAALAAGKHVLVEKPMAADLEGAQRIARAAARAARQGIQLMPAYNLRFHPVAQRVKELVADRELGEIVRVRRLHGHYMEYEAARFSCEEVTAGWGPLAMERRDSLFFAGSHVALWFDWMFGLPESVVSMSTSAVRGLPVEDNSSSLLRYGRFHASMEVSETLSAQLAVTEIYGTEGVLVQSRGNLPSTRVLNPSRAPLAIFRRSSSTWELPELPPSFLRHESSYSSVGQFFQSLLRQEPVPTTAEDGLRSIAILVAAERSAAEGREVRLDELLSTSTEPAP